MKPGMRVFATVMSVILLDGLTKVWAEQALNSPIPVIGRMFRLTLGYNTGVAFGLFTNGGIFPIIITGAVMIVLSIWFFATFRKGELPTGALMPLALIFGGGLANFLDRLPDGRVTDFLDFGLGSTRWPTFNLADSFLVVGVAILLITIVLNNPTDKEYQP